MLDKGSIEIKLGPYGVASATALSDPSIHPAVQDFRRQTGSRMYPLDREDITRKMPTANYHVSRKMDGEFTVLVYRNGSIFSINPGGTIRVGLPWHEEAEKALKDAGIKEAMVAGELYVNAENGKRERVHDVTSVARQPENQDQLSHLRFAVFDLINVDGARPGENFSETFSRIEKIFGKGKLVHTVESKTVDGSDEIEKLFQKWVIDEGSEGVVARSDSAGLFKIKPRHTLDVGVIGFTESSDERTGMMHDLLLAVMRKDRAIHVLCRVGGGFKEELRREMLSDLKDMIVESEYAEVNSDHVAYQMIQPKLVIEISCLDMISQTTRGGPVNRMALNWNRQDSRYEVIRRLPLCSVISPQYIRHREDKTFHPDDIRIQQIADVVEVPMYDRDATEMTLPKSQVLHREVFTKLLKGETMVRKFMMWKTNKENESDEFPAYVLHYTDFSPNRKTPLSREVRVSNSLEQIEQLCAKMKEANIKKGWNPVVVHADAEKGVSPKKSVAKKEVTKEAVKEEADLEVPKKEAKKAPKKKAAAKKAAKKAAVKKVMAEEKEPANEAVKKAAPKKKSAPKKKAAEKAAEEKTPTKKAAPKKKAAKKAPAKKAPAKKAAPKKKAAKKKAPAKKAPKKKK